MNLLRRFRFPLIGGAVVVLIVGFLLFRPDKLFIDDAVDESLDQAFAPESTDEDTALTTVPPATAPSTTPAPEAATPAGEVEETAPDPVADAVPTTTAPNAPTLVGTGPWTGIGHTAAGTASIYTQEGRSVLRFEDDTDIQNGPDLFVWLLPSDDYQGGTPADPIDLGKIKGNVGGQNYELPDEYDPAVHQYVLIWCLRFAVPFAGAPLG